MEIANKDVYEYILNLADDKTTINMIRANPKVFDNEKFYEKVMRKRYPLLIEFRKENETWKELYLRMVYVLAKLQEDYKIPYIPTKGCDPKKILNAGTPPILNPLTIYNLALECAAAGGHVHLIDLFLQKADIDIDGALGMAGQYSNINTVKHLISKGAKDYVFLLISASRSGNIEVMKFAFDLLKSQGQGINEYGTRVLIRAIDNDQIKAIEFLIQNGLRIVPKDIQYAENTKKYEIAEYLKQFIEN